MRAKTRASLIASLRAGRRPRRPRRRPAPRQRAGRQGRAGDQARGQGHRAGAGRERALRAAPREHRRHRRDARALVPGARRPHRRRRRLQRLGLCLDSCHLFASGYDIRTEEGLSEALDECDAAWGSRPRLAAPQRLPDAAGLQPRSPRRRRRGRARPPRLRGLPLRAALRRTALRAGDAGTRRPRSDAGADHPDPASTQSGRAPASLGRRICGYTRVRGPPPPVQQRAVVHHRARRKEGDPPPPVQR